MAHSWAISGAPVPAYVNVHDGLQAVLNVLNNHSHRVETLEQEWKGSAASSSQDIEDLANRLKELPPACDIHQALQELQKQAVIAKSYVKSTEDFFSETKEEFKRVEGRLSMLDDHKQRIDADLVSRIAEDGQTIKRLEGRLQVIDDHTQRIDKGLANRIAEDAQTTDSLKRLEGRIQRLDDHKQVIEKAELSRYQAELMRISEDVQTRDMIKRLESRLQILDDTYHRVDTVIRSTDDSLSEMKAVLKRFEGQAQTLDDHKQHTDKVIANLEAVCDSKASAVEARTCQDERERIWKKIHDVESKTDGLQRHLDDRPYDKWHGSASQLELRLDRIDVEMRQKCNELRLLVESAQADKRDMVSICQSMRQSVSEKTLCVDQLPTTTHQRLNEPDGNAHRVLIQKQESDLRVVINDINHVREEHRTKSAELEALMRSSYEDLMEVKANKCDVERHLGLASEAIEAARANQANLATLHTTCEGLSSFSDSLGRTLNEQCRDLRESKAETRDVEKPMALAGEAMKAARENQENFAALHKMCEGISTFSESLGRSFNEQCRDLRESKAGKRDVEKHLALAGGAIESKIREVAAARKEQERLMAVHEKCEGLSMSVKSIFDYVVKLDFCCKELGQRLDKLDPPDSTLWRAVRTIEQHGNIKVDHITGQVKLLSVLEFEQRTTDDEPLALLLDPIKAQAVCKDLAELSNTFSCPVLIEGNTKGGESIFWQTLAERRALAIAQTMINFGANANLLQTQALPGRLGKNEARVEVYINIKDQSSVISNRAKQSVMPTNLALHDRVIDLDLGPLNKVMASLSSPGGIIGRPVAPSAPRSPNRGRVQMSNARNLVTSLPSSG